ncbi:MAG TPA: (Fe-S)-binding protein, partial [Gemmatales bacterium]|nr:(Fe-S)-binding protein [Gemmatales bacterium]
INDVVLRQVNWTTAKVLQINGCDVWTSSSQGCCGALHLHNGRENQAVDFATQLVTDMQKYKNIDAIINNIAGCGSTLKEYEHLLESTPISKQGTWFQSKVKDIHEFLSELKPVKPTRPLRMKAVYHDACHLCHAQKIRQQPRELLGIIPELELVPLNETEICCGAAGSYNLSQPEMAERLGNRKWQNILKTDVKAVFTGNAGCLLQIAKHKRFSNSDICVVHPVQALWASYSGEPLESI